MAFSEMQSRVFFAVQAGQCELPSLEQMKQDTDVVEETLLKRYVQSPRHTIQVCFFLGGISCVTSLIITIVVFCLINFC
jgi:hypothetical protein